MMYIDSMQAQHDTQFQDLDWARPRIQTYIKNNKTRDRGTSISGLFSMIRKQRHLSLIGDYPLFWVIMDETKETNKSKIRTALRKSEEYRSVSKKEKMWWLNSLAPDATK